MRMWRVRLHRPPVACRYPPAGCVRGSLAQHEVTADDVAEGERLFTSTCTGCHGAEGDARVWRGSRARTVPQFGNRRRPRPHDQERPHRDGDAAEHLHGRAGPKPGRVPAIARVHAALDGPGRSRPRQGTLRGQGQMRHVPPRRGQRLAVRSGPERHRSAAEGPGTGALPR